MADEDGQITSEPEESVPVGRATIIYICAALGGLVAAIADVVQKEEASAVVKLTSMSARHLGLVMQPLYVLACLVCLAVALCMVFQPADRRQSFGVGMAIIAVIMTVTPYKQPLTGLPGSGPAGVNSSKLNGMVEIASNEEKPALGGYLSGGGIGFPSPIFVMEVTNTSQVPAVVGVSVFLPTTGTEFYQKNIANPGQTIQVPFSLEGLLPGNQFNYRVDVNGRSLTAQSGEVQHGVTEAELQVGDEGILDGGITGSGNPTNTMFPSSIESPTSIFEQIRKPFAW